MAYALVQLLYQGERSSPLQRFMQMGTIISKINGFLFAHDATWRRDFTFLALLFGTIYLQFLGRLPFMEPDEGRYAEIPREMLESGDFITPYLNYVKYFEKPPLIYWLNALSMKLFGQNEFAARLPGALCGVLTILFIYFLGRTLFGRRQGMVAALILGSSAGFMIQNRMILTDIPLTFCLTTALGCFILASREGERQAALYYYLFYIFAALAVLAKGLIGMVLPGGVIFFHLLLTRRWRLLKEMRIPTGLFLFFLVGAPWFILVSMKNPEFARFFFIHEHFERFLTKVHGRYQPLWFFIPILLVGMLPWSALIPVSFRGIWGKRRQADGESRLYLAIWFILIFLFFSKSNSKLIPYILPVYPAAALLMGDMIVRTLDGEKLLFWPFVRIMAGLMMIVGIAGIVAPAYVPDKVLTPEVGALIGGLFFLQGVIAALAVRRKNPLVLVTGVTATALLLMLVGPPFVLDRVAEHKQLKSMGEELLRVAPPDALVVGQGVLQGLSFYAQRRVVILGGMGELEFGSLQGNQKGWFINYPELVTLWDSARPVYLVINRQDLRELNSKVRNPLRILQENRKRVLVCNR
jgi:4-amino-4-deoxy-L-arabinose transferase-like glycosyltransferase